ncbi:MAG: transposase [Cyclobacteriaceae bacterium]|jgi:transposase
MKLTHFVGIDISKASFDVALCRQNQPESFTYEKFINSFAGCQKLLRWLHKQKVDCFESFFIMEHTGWYTLELCCFLQEQKLSFSLFSPLHLKRSLGLARGKNDQVDALRLAYYGFLHRHELQSLTLPSETLLKLKNLFAFRDRLIKTQASLKQTLRDLKDTSHLIDNKFIIKQSEKQSGAER